MLLKDFLLKNSINNLSDLVMIIKAQGNKIPVDIVYQAAEYLNPNRDSTAAFYTDECICKYIMNELPDFEDKDHITIMEPSVGAGNFIRFVAEKYKSKSIVELYLVDIDEKELKIAELIYETYFRDKYPNIALIYINDDYLKFPVSGKKFDLIIGNPPYSNLKDLKLLKEYKKNSKITKSSNLFVLFLEKAIHDARWVSLVVPKSVLNAPEYVEIRDLINSYSISSILDFGENGFKGVKIETINLMFTEAKLLNDVHVKSITQKIDIMQPQEYITDKKYPSWLLYRNKTFDTFANTLRLGVFNSYRDRQIVNSMLSNNGKYRVLKSRNIVSKGIVDIKGYDSYINSIQNLGVAQFLNKKDVVLMPNLTYSPRACFLPNDTITNGSVALLTVKDKSIKITEEDLELFATKEFANYYRIARNYGTRSLNIDNNSVFFFGIRR